MASEVWGHMRKFVQGSVTRILLGIFADTILVLGESVLNVQRIGRYFFNVNNWRTVICYCLLCSSVVQEDSLY
jgi:hypothetical protein